MHNRRRKRLLKGVVRAIGLILADGMDFLVLVVLKIRVEMNITPWLCIENLANFFRGEVRRVYRKIGRGKFPNDVT